MNEHYYAVIMAGGGGTRLWPLSRKSRPKQMLSLTGGESLFQAAIRRLDGIFPNDRIYIVTTEDQAGELHEQAPQIPVDHFLLEPKPRGTAAVVGLAASILEQQDPQAVMSVLTSDHHIGNEEKFRQLLKSAYDVALQGYLVTLGITPTHPATGYGYIQYGELLGDYGNIKAYRVQRFKEKPNLTQAQLMLAGGDHAWNSGMFVWRVKDILKEFDQQLPEHYQAFMKIAQAWKTSERSQVLHAVWQYLEVITIDYGIMEGAQNIAVIPAIGLDWNDIGSWESIYDLFPKDKYDNVTTDNKHLFLDAHGNLIYRASPERLIVAISVNNLVIVDTGDVLLIMDKEHTQQVRQAVEELKTTHPEYL